MRVYLPTTVERLGALPDNGFPPSSPGFAVTGALREAYREGDAEELEYAAMLAAARHCLGMLAGGSGPWRRVVVAVDVPDAAVQVAQPELAAGPAGHGAVLVMVAVPLSTVASIHVDDDDARDAVQAAAGSWKLALTADEQALFTVDEAAGHDLLWYDVSELADVLALR